MKKRINMTIDPTLHAWATSHAKTELGTDFSGYIAGLIVADRARVKTVNAFLAKQQLAPGKK